MKITIIGASGHGRVAADIAKLMGYDRVEFLDDDESLTSCNGYPIVGNTSKTVTGDVFVAIGNALTRKKLSQEKCLTTLIHPNAVIAEDVEIGIGSIVMAGTVINTGTKIGRGVIVNTCSSIDHDCVVGDFAHIAVGSHLCGTVNIGNNTWVGAGATVCNNVNVCVDCMIGAGAVVIEDLETSGTYVGVPARLIKKVKGK